MYNNQCICYPDWQVSSTASIKVINNLKQDIIVIPRAVGAWGCKQEYPLRNGGKIKYVCMGAKAILPGIYNEFTFDDRAHCKNFAMTTADEKTWYYYNIDINDFGRLFDTEYLLRNATTKDPITALGTCLFTR